MDFYLIASVSTFQCFHITWQNKFILLVPFEENLACQDVWEQLACRDDGRRRGDGG